MFFSSRQGESEVKTEKRELRIQNKCTYTKVTRGEELIEEFEEGNRDKRNNKDNKKVK